MKCLKCHSEMPEDALHCPKCQAEKPTTQNPSSQIRVTQRIGKVNGGTVKGVEIGKAEDVIIQNTINEIKTKIVKGDYVNQQSITNIIIDLGPQALDKIVERIVEMLGIDKRILQNLGNQSVPENVSRQIAEVKAVEKDVASRGLPVSAQALYRLGMLAAYDRKYEEALEYFRQATEVNEDYIDAYEAIA